MRVEMPYPDGENLLSLILARLIERRSDRASTLQGRFTVVAGGMVTQLSFEPDTVLIRSGPGQTKCEIHSSLDTLTRLALGG